MKSTALLRTLALALLGVFLSVFQYLHFIENPRGTYASYAEMEQSGLIARGWLPNYLPTSATDIEESHNIDTNRVWAAFKYHVGDVGSVESSCKQVAQNELGTKYLCPPFDTQTATVVLRNNGEGYYLRYENGI